MAELDASNERTLGVDASAANDRGGGIGEYGYMDANSGGARGPPGPLGLAIA
jgi:hypothetical protein